MALRNLGIDHEVVAVAEIDKFAIKSYEAIHGETFNLGDVSQVEIEDIPDHDLFTYSFPCQDISVAGNGLGLDEGSGTRSGLLWECQKIIDGKKPKYLLLENVKNLVGKRHKPNFDKWLEWLEEQGYTNYWEVLNAKHYGVPQNRERVFVVSILGEHEPYEFPKPTELTTRLRDVLEPVVDKKFYLSQKIQDRLTLNPNFKNDIKTIGTTKGKENTRLGQRDVVYSDEGIMGTLSATDYKQPKQILDNRIKQIAQYNTPTRNNSNRFRTYDETGLAPTLGTMGGGGLGPHVIAASRGRNPENPNDRTVGSPTVQKDNLVIEQVRVLAEKARPNTEIGVTIRPNGDIRPHRMDIKKSGIQELNINHEDNPSHTVTSAHMPKVYGDITDFRIRKLTPKECWRLMGFSDEDFHKAEAVNSNSQLYKQAGNSIVAPVLEAIFKQLFKEAHT